MEPLQHKLNSFRKLVDALPESLPLHYSGHKLFGPDPDDFEDMGYAGALNRCFEINWGMRIHGIRITERGDKLATTLAILQQSLEEMSTTDDLGLVELWLDVFIETAAKLVPER
ncbi:hypothetical protein C2E23DRAFT_724896 [Lenzites betulinus]|nr:hypothetical protein C2E23DRAFT_724896 [Lenzites betulinus]